MIGELSDKGVADDGKMVARIDDVPFVCIPKTYPFLEKLERGYQVEYELDEENRIKKIWRAKKAATAPKEDFTTAERMKKAGFNVPAKETMTEAEVEALKARADEAQREKAHAEEMEKINREAKEHQAKMAKENEARKAAQNPAPVTQMVPVHITPIAYSEDEMLLLRNVIAKVCSEPEFKLLMYMANTYGLDPLLKQIWAVKRSENAPALIFAGRDGMLAIAHRSGRFDGMQSGVVYDNDRKPISAWCEVWRKDMSHSFKTEVPFSEYNTGFSVWKSNPSAMILKVAEAVCLRKAFSVSGLYAPEEIS